MVLVNVPLCTAFTTVLCTTFLSTTFFSKCTGTPTNLIVHLYFIPTGSESYPEPPTEKESSRDADHDGGRTAGAPSNIVIDSI
jgi:hypothetical protein